MPGIEDFNATKNISTTGSTCLEKSDAYINVDAKAPSLIERNGRF